MYLYKISYANTINVVMASSQKAAIYKVIGVSKDCALKIYEDFKIKFLSRV